MMVPVETRASAASGDEWTERWVVYLASEFSAKELTVEPGSTVTVRDTDAYGCIVVAGFGTMSARTISSPTLIRYGQLTEDELYVSERRGPRRRDDHQRERHGAPGHPEALRTGKRGARRGRRSSRRWAVASAAGQAPGAVGSRYCSIGRIVGLEGSPDLDGRRRDRHADACAVPRLRPERRGDHVPCREDVPGPVGVDLGRPWRRHRPTPGGRDHGRPRGAGLVADRPAPSDDRRLGSTECLELARGREDDAARRRAGCRTAVGPPGAARWPGRSGRRRSGCPPRSRARPRATSSTRADHRTRASPPTRGASPPASAWSSAAAGDPEAGRSLEVEHERPGAVGLVGHEDRSGRCPPDRPRGTVSRPRGRRGAPELRAEHVVAHAGGELDVRAQAGGGAGEDDGRAARERPVEGERGVCRVVHEGRDRLADHEDRRACRRACRCLHR